MGKIVNLRRAKKAKARADKAKRGAENAAIYGRTTTERAATRQIEAKRRSELDGARLDYGGAKTDRMDQSE